MREDINMQEIGSEFSTAVYDNKEGLTFLNGGVLVFSGRTSIETVLKEIPYAKKAVLPSYCCESMIVPFRKAGIDVVFYDVWYEEELCTNVDIQHDVDIFLWCNYFGFKNEMPDLTAFKERGGIIIEDITHSFLSEQQYHEQSDYLVASIRKWEPIYCGGYCVARKSELNYLPTVEPSSDFIARKEMAMKLKSEYLYDNDETKKQEYLKLFKESNSWLADNYSGLAIDSWSKQYLSSVDIHNQREKRRANAHMLYEGLQGKVQFLFPKDDMDCPLFVPILLFDNRNELRSKLVANGIYCPIHWPKPQGCESNLYDMELSLICDQRYTEEDMKRIVSVI